MPIGRERYEPALAGLAVVGRWPRVKVGGLGSVEPGRNYLFVIEFSINSVLL